MYPARIHESSHDVYPLKKFLQKKLQFQFHKFFFGNVSSPDTDSGAPIHSLENPVFDFLCMNPATLWARVVRSLNSIGQQRKGGGCLKRTRSDRDQKQKSVGPQTAEPFGHWMEIQDASINSFIHIIAGARTREKFRTISKSTFVNMVKQWWCIN